MRLFVGIRPSETFRAALAALQDLLCAAGVGGRYLDPSNLHLTLAFIGEWPEDVTPLLPRVERPFSIRLSRPGVFPAAKVLWAGTEKSGPLNSLARQVRDNLARNGVPFDPKAFNPHITLIRKPSIPEGVALSGIEVPPVEMIVDEVCLYSSRRGENGMEYTVIGSTLDQQGEQR